MARIALIDQLGLGDQVLDIYEEEQDYTRTASRITLESGQKISMQQVRGYVMANADNPVPRAAITKQDNDSPEAVFVPLSEIVKYDEFKMARSLSDITSILTNNYQYCYELLNKVVRTPEQAVMVLKEIRSTLEVGIKAADVVRTHESAVTFERDVIDALRESDEGALERFTQSLRQRRTLRLPSASTSDQV